MVKLDENATKEFTKDHEQGMTFANLGKKYGMGSTTARAYAIQLGIYNNNAKRMKHLDDEQKKQVIEMYKGGASYATIAAIFKVGDGTVQRIIQKEGISRHCGGSNKYPTHVEIEICDSYINYGYTLAELGEKYHMNDSSILGLLRRYNVETRATKERKYDINDHFFDVIDTESKAYFFGLLYSDGNTSDLYPEIVLSLQEEDGYLVEEMNRLVSNNRPCTIRKKREEHHKDQVKMAMYSRHMKDVLVSYGMVPAKSLVKTFPDVIMNSSEDIQRHFIRGYFDGNGSIGIYSRQKNGKHSNYFASISITSTQEMCAGIKELFDRYVGVNVYVYKASSANESNTYVVKMGGFDNVKTVMEWLYKDSTHRMVRKYNIYQDVLKHIINFKK